MYNYDGKIDPNIHSYIAGFCLIADRITEQFSTLANQLAQMTTISRFILWKVHRKGMATRENIA